MRIALCLLLALFLGCSGDSSTSDDDTDVGQDVSADSGDASTDAGSDVDEDTADDADVGEDDAGADADVTDDTGTDADAGCEDDDGDGVCNDEDICEGFDDGVDDDGDGVPNGCDDCSSTDDTDGDGVPDDCDICADGDDADDADEDGVPDACDVCADGDDQMDADGDGIPDDCDNEPPSLQSATLTPDDPVEASTLTCTAEGAADPDGDAVFVSYAWTVEGIEVDGEAEATLSGEFFAKGEEVHCTVTPNDGTVDGTPVDSNTVTIGNTAPVITDVTIEPTTPTELSTPRCVVTALDADMDDITYAYAWFVGGSELGETREILGASSYARGDEIYCVATPSDGDDDGTPVESNRVTVGNAPPSVDAATLTPTSATEATTFDCAPGTPSDADGDGVTFTFAWLVNDTDVGVSATTLDGTHFNRDDRVACVVTPTDGDAVGTAVSSNEVTVSNSAPTMPNVMISPANPAAEDDLECIAADSTDADGDSVNLAYAWSRNDATTGLTSPIVASSETSPGDEWVCTVTPTDGTDTGPSGQATVTVLNAPVTIGGIDRELGCGNADTFGANFSLGSGPFTVSGSFTLTGFHLRGCTPGAGVRMALYAFSGGDVGALVAESVQGTVSAGPVELAPLGGPQTLPAGTYLITAVYSSGGLHAQSDMAPSTLTYYEAMPFGGAFPSPMTESTYDGSDFGYWITGTLN